MKNLFDIGKEIEHVFQVFSIPQETLRDLLSKRESLLDCMEEVDPGEAQALMEQDKRILEKCELAKEMLERQIDAVNNKNRKSLMSQRFGHYHDSHC